MNKFLGKSSLIRVKTLDNKNLLASRFIKRQKGSLPVVVRRSKTSLLKLAIDAQAYFQKLKSHDFICKILTNNVFHCRSFLTKLGELFTRETKSGLDYRSDSPRRVTLFRWYGYPPRQPVQLLSV